MMDSKAASSLIISTALNGDYNVLRDILQSGRVKIEDVVALDRRRNSVTFGECALHRAPTVDIAKLLVEFGVPPDIKGALGQTPLHVQCENYPVSSYLISVGASVDAVTKDGSTPLEWAVVADCFEVVDLLVQAGADVNHQNKNGNAPLHHVQSVAIAKYLIEHGAKVSTTNNFGQIPLETAAEVGHSDEKLEVAAYLLEVSHARGLRQRSISDVSIHMLQTRESSNSRLLTENERRIRARKRWDRIRKQIFDPSIPGGFRAIASGNIEWGFASNTPANDTFDNESYSSFIPSRGDDGTGDSHIVDSPLHGSQHALSSFRRSSSNESAAKIEPSSASLHGDFKMPGHETFYTFFFEAMVRDRPLLAKKMLDQQRTFIFARGINRAYNYDLSLLGGPISSKAGLRMIADYNRHDLVSHDVVQFLLNAKWHLFVQHCLLYEMIKYIIYMLSFTATALLGPLAIRVEYDAFMSAVTTAEVFDVQYEKDMEHIDGNYTKNGLAILFICEIILTSMSIYFFLRLIAEWWRRGHSWRVAVKIFLSDRYKSPFYLTVLIEQACRLFLNSPTDSFEDFHLSTFFIAIGIVMCWVQFILFFEPYELVGVTMCIVRNMIHDILVYGGFLVLFLTGFSSAMASVFRESDNMNYNTVFVSYRTLFFFVFNLDVGALEGERNQYRQIMGFLILAVYMSMVALVMLNIIVAVMASTFEKITNKSKEEWLLQRARAILRMEDMFVHSMSEEIQEIEREFFLIDHGKIMVVENAYGFNEIRVPESWVEAFQKYKNPVTAFWLGAKRFRMPIPDPLHMITASPSLSTSSPVIDAQEVRPKVLKGVSTLKRSSSTKEKQAPKQNIVSFQDNLAKHSSTDPLLGDRAKISPSKNYSAISSTNAEVSASEGTNQIKGVSNNNDELLSKAEAGINQVRNNNNEEENQTQEDKTVSNTEPRQLKQRYNSSPGALLLESTGKHEKMVLIASYPRSSTRNTGESSNKMPSIASISKAFLNRKNQISMDSTNEAIAKLEQKQQIIEEKLDRLIRLFESNSTL